MRAVEAAFFDAFDPSAVLDHGIHFNCTASCVVVLSSRCQESFRELLMRLRGFQDVNAVLSVAAFIAVPILILFLGKLAR